MLEDRTRYNILFSCVGKEKSDFNPFVPDHAISFVINGKMVINDGTEVVEFQENEVGFFSKNQLVKTQKIPSNNQSFTSISIFLPKEILFNYSQKNNITTIGNYLGKRNIKIEKNPFLKGFLNSMLPYFENPSKLNENLVEYKTMELIEILLQDDKMQNILFNFEENYKLDLEAFMNQNYMHNIPLEQFAKLTGRSISTFKRDFQKTFQTTPNKWLQKKRLNFAHYLITTKHKKPVDVYYEAGFLNFSHFSKSFKEEFGINASEI